MTSGKWPMTLRRSTMIGFGRHLWIKLNQRSEGDGESAYLPQTIGVMNRFQAGVWNPSAGHIVLEEA